MDNNSVLQLQQFIKKNALDPQKGIILFNATITLHSNENPLIISSEVQIITLPKEMVLYILEFVKATHLQSEIYSTRLYHFEHTGNTTLVIKEPDGGLLLTVSI
ncbi:MAG: hypothetical protein V4685_10690 [Bacteroidota bacterium]